MTFHVTVLYPNEDDTKFDLKYYLATHMPLVKKGWTQYGLKSYKVNEFGPGPDGSKPPFCIGATLVWGSGEEVQKAMGSEEAKGILGDIPNFCNKQPTFLTGEVVGED